MSSSVHVGVRPQCFHLGRFSCSNASASINQSSAKLSHAASSTALRDFSAFRRQCSARSRQFSARVLLTKTALNRRLETGRVEPICHMERGASLPQHGVPLRAWGNVSASLRSSFASSPKRSWSDCVCLKRRRFCTALLLSNSRKAGAQPAFSSPIDTQNRAVISGNHKQGRKFLTWRNVSPLGRVKPSADRISGGKLPEANPRIWHRSIPCIIAS